MDTKAAKDWLKSALLAAGAGGIGAAMTAAMDPSKYRFPHDFGSGKLLAYFGEGFAVTLAAMALKSKLGQQAMGAFRQSEKQLADAKNSIAKKQ